jgi:phage/plasmid-associated DNA primase
MSIFLETVKGIFSRNLAPKLNAKPLCNPATGRALQAWASEARALTMDEAETLRGVWMGAQVGDLVLPTYDANGAIVGARLWTQEGTRLAPRADSGLATTGAVLANRSGRAWLGGKINAPACILIAEGEPDFVVLCLFAAEMERRYPGYVYAVLGIYSGAWSREFGAKITAESTVAICTDKDKAGEGYAGLIRASIAADVEVTRWAGFGDNDVEECARAGLDLIALIFEQASQMPAPPTQDEGRWGWTDAAGWAELPAWAAARESEKAWAAARSMPREALGDAMLERARKYCETKLAAVAQELEGLDGDRTRALQLMAPVMSLVAGGALDRATVEGELVAAYVSGDKETRKDRHTQILTALKSGPGGRPREAITLEDIAAKLKVEDDERAREAEARRKRQSETKPEAPKESRKNTKNEAAESDAPEGMGDVSSVENWHEEIDAMGWDRTPSEVELAHRLIEYLTPPGHPRPVSDEGTLWRYSQTEGVWVEVTAASVTRIVSGWDKCRTDDKKQLKISEKASRAARAIAMHLVEWVGFFGRAPRGVMLKSQFLAVDVVKKTVALEAPSPDHRARHKLSADPKEPGSLLSQYIATAHDGEDAQEKIELMGQVAFSALAGLGTVYKKAVLLFGEKGTGKSQFLKLVQGLVPQAAQCTVLPQKMGEDYHCAALANKTLNIVGELEADEFLKEGNVKSIMHGEPIQARQPRGEVFQLVPIALHLFCANCLPAAPGVSPAFWDRWIVVGFEKAWTGEARVMLDGGVADIAERILESDLAGLLGWAIDCGRKLVSAGAYIIPESSKRLMKEWQAEGDSVAAWLEERAKILDRTAPQHEWAKALTAYEDYKFYTDQHNFRPVNSRKFKSRLQSCGVKNTRGASGSLYCVKLKS